MTSTIGITGANGYLGRHLTNHFLNAGWHVKGLTRTQSADSRGESVIGDIREAETCTKFVQGCHVIIHTAAYVHRVAQTEADIAACFAINRDATIALIDLAAAQPTPPFFLFVSTVAAIGETTSPYAVSKRDAEDYLHNLIDQNKIQGCTVRPCMIYGTNAPGNLQSVIRLAKFGFVPIFDKGKNRKSLLFIEHAVAAIALCITNPEVANGERLTLTDGVSLTLREIVTTICNVLPNKPYVISIPLMPVKYMLTLWDGLSRLSGGKLPKLKQTFLTYIGSAVFSADKFIRLFNFQPPYTTIQALSKAYTIDEP